MTINCVERDHLAALAGQSWYCWKMLLVRSSGFSVSSVLDLASPDLLRRTQEALASRTKLAADKPPHQATHRFPDRSLLEEIEKEIAPVWTVAMEHARSQLRKHASDPRFQCAVAWQNSNVYENALLPFIEDRRATPSRIKKREAVISRYFHRYTTKNDTIGFFGPSFWADLDLSISHVEIKRGINFLRKERVYFEDWAVQNIAKALRSEYYLRDENTPLRDPRLVFTTSGILDHEGRFVELVPEKLRLISLCDGRTALARIVSLMQAQLGEHTTRDSIVANLVELENLNFISLTQHCSTYDLMPEQRLLQALSPRAGETDGRLPGVALVDEALRLRATVEQAYLNTGNPHESIVRATAKYELLFGEAGTRRAGQTYGARSIFYLESARDLNLKLSKVVLDKIAQPLSLVLDSARWFASSSIEAYKGAFKTIFVTSLEHGATEMPFPQFWRQASVLVFRKQLDVLAPCINDLHSRWSRILQISDSGDVVHLTAETLAPLVEREFSLRGIQSVAWCHFSPDIMFATNELQSMKTGMFQCVLGELHAGVNTLMTNASLDIHNRRDEVTRAARLDLQGKRFIPVFSVSDTRQPIRTRLVADPELDVEVLFDPHVRPSSSRFALASDFVVRFDGENVLICSDALGTECEITDFLGYLLSQMIAGRFSILAPQPRIPRISVDHLTIHRRTWLVPCHAILGCRVGDESNWFLRVVSLSQTCDLPRFLFVKMPWEMKPVYLDLANPMLVKQLVSDVFNAIERKSAAADASLSLSEMYPSHDQCWLPGPADSVVTSEFRLAAIHSDDIASRNRPHG